MEGMMAPKHGDMALRGTAVRYGLHRSQSRCLGLVGGYGGSIMVSLCPEWLGGDAEGDGVQEPPFFKAEPQN